MKCSGETRSKGMNFLRLHPCRCEASVERDGKPYCKRHDPVAIAKRQRASFERRSARLMKKIRLELHAKYHRLRKVRGNRNG